MQTEELQQSSMVANIRTMAATPAVPVAIEPMPPYPLYPPYPPYPPAPPYAPDEMLAYTATTSSSQIPAQLSDSTSTEQPDLTPEQPAELLQPGTHSTSTSDPNQTTVPSIATVPFTPPPPHAIHRTDY